MLKVWSARFSGLVSHRPGSTVNWRDEPAITRNHRQIGSSIMRPHAALSARRFRRVLRDPDLRREGSRRSRAPGAIAAPALDGLASLTQTAIRYRWTSDRALRNPARRRRRMAVYSVEDTGSAAALSCSPGNTTRAGAAVCTGRAAPRQPSQHCRSTTSALPTHGHFIVLEPAGLTLRRDARRWSARVASSHQARSRGSVACACRGIVHRDVKPKTWMVRTATSRCWTRLARLLPQGER